MAQSKPIKGDITSNVETHKNLVTLALSCGAGIIIFPELSLTGYEPTMAMELATTSEVGRFNPFQSISDSGKITIGVGIPLVNYPHPTINMLIFQSHEPRQVYSKQHLHADEEPYFVNGRNSSNILGNYTNIALAICYEISVPQHAQMAFENGAEIYLASVAKTERGIEQAHRRLSEIARTYSMTVMLSNCVGSADGERCGGRSAVWNNQGHLLGQLDDVSEGLLIFDTVTREVIRG